MYSAVPSVNLGSGRFVMMSAASDERSRRASLNASVASRRVSSPSDAVDSCDSERRRALASSFVGPSIGEACGEAVGDEHEEPSVKLPSGALASSGGGKGADEWGNVETMGPVPPRESGERGGEMGTVPPRESGERGGERSGERGGVGVPVGTDVIGPLRLRKSDRGGVGATPPPPTLSGPVLFRMSERGGVGSGPVLFRVSERGGVGGLPSPSHKL